MSDLSSSAPHASRRVSRRQVLAAALTGGIAATLAGPTAAQAATSPPRPANAEQYFADPDLNFQALFALGASSYNAAETGEVLAAFNRVHARGDTYRAFYEEFLALGQRLHQRADDALRHGRKVTARDSYLRAATYLDQALFFVLASATPTRAQEGRVYQEMEACFARAAALSEPAFTRVAIPYERRTLPGWLMTPPGAGTRRPTLILNNGSDAQNIDLYVSGAVSAVQRGWNALIFEGPGQGSNLFLHNIPFRPDWEKVITPVVDFLRARPEVDPRRISLFGSSFGGYLVPRAAAFEHRLAGVALDPGVHNAFITWSRSLPKNMLGWLREGRQQEFNGYWAQAQHYMTAPERFYIAKRAEIYGPVSLFDQMRLASRFVLSRGLARQITAPTVIAQAQNEIPFPHQSRQLHEWLTATKSLAHFTAAEGAQFHCEPMAPALRNDTMLDWLEANLQPTA